jgi:hypothetical protein
MNLLIPIGDDGVELFSDKIFALEGEDAAKATADGIDDQFAAGRIVFLDESAGRAQAAQGLESIIVVDEAVPLPSHHGSNSKRLRGAIFEDVDFLPQFSCVFDDEFSVLLEVSGGEHVHGVKGSGVEQEQTALVPLYYPIVEDVELVHSADDLKA